MSKAELFSRIGKRVAHRLAGGWIRIALAVGLLTAFGLAWRALTPEPSYRVNILIYCEWAADVEGIMVNEGFRNIDTILLDNVDMCVTSGEAPKRG